MFLIGVIFLASYKLAKLYSLQNREIERNVAIHQALTAYDRVFDGHEQSPPFESLRQQLQELRMNSVPQDPNNIKLSTNSSSFIPNSEKRYVYRREEIHQLRCVLGDIEVPPAVQSYQSIVHIPESPPIKRTTNKKSQNKKKVEPAAPSDRHQWGRSAGPTLDSLLAGVVGNDHYIVSDRPSQEQKISAGDVGVDEGEST